MTGFVLNMTGFLLYMSIFVLNMSVFVLILTSYFVYDCQSNGRVKKMTNYPHFVDNRGVGPLM